MLKNALVTTENLSNGLVNKLVDLTGLTSSQVSKEIYPSYTEENFYIKPESPIYLPFIYLSAYRTEKIDNVDGTNFCDEYSKFHKENHLSTKDKIPYNIWKAIARYDAKISLFECSYIDEDSHIIGVRFPNKGKPDSFSYFYTTSNFIDFFRNFISNKEDKPTVKMPTNFEFGPIKDGSVVLSPCGIAVKSGNSYMAYNSNTRQTVDVTGFTFDFEGMIYKMPVALNGVQSGDIILHNGKPMFVSDVSDNAIAAIDITASEAKTIIPITNVFGFNFVTKIVSMMNMTGMAPSADQPFGNLMPLLMMQSFFSKEDANSKDPFVKMMMFSAMMNGGDLSAMFPQINTIFAAGGNKAQRQKN